MKCNTYSARKPGPQWPRVFWVALLLAVLGLSSASADIVYVTGCVSNCTSTTICGNLPNSDINIYSGNMIYNENALGNFTSAKATGAGVADKPTTPGSRYFSNSFSNSTPDMGVTLSPMLSVTGAVYRIDHTYSSSAGNCSSNIIVGLTNVSGCTLSVTNTDKFKSIYGAVPNSWSTIGYLTNDLGSANPQITLYYVSGTVSASLQNRVEMDCFRFVLAQPCLGVSSPTVTGPLATNNSVVRVNGVVTNATSVTVYQDSGGGMVSVGVTNITVSPAPATIEVPVTGLAYAAQVGATQTVGGQESCVPTAGTLVGTGPNSSLRIALSIRGNPDLQGPVGSTGGGTNSNVYFLGASAFLAGACPDDAPTIYPSNTWQTVTFQRGPDSLNPINPTVLWNNGSSGTSDLEGDFGALDGIAIACEGDPGNFDIYIDDLSNGTNGVFEDFEAGAAGSTIGFSQPSFSGTTAGSLLSSPNSATIVTNTAFSGAKCTRVQWQFLDGATNKWLRLVHSGNTGVANPQVQLEEPISFKLLLLRPGDPVPPPPQPILPGTISIQQSGGNIVLTWSGSYPLQSASNVTGPYTDVSGVTNAPYTTPVTGDAQFFRLRGN
jgi:hypothetical protein